MARKRSALRAMFGTRRGIRVFSTQTFVAFGLVSAIVQFASVLVSGPLPHPLTVLIGCAVLCVGWGAWRVVPPRRIEHAFERPEVVVTVAVGDLLDQDCPIAVGFSDTFDTEVRPGLIALTSLQGQLLQRRYGGDVAVVDGELERALRDVQPTRSAEQLPGKQLRYPLGTVAVIGGVGPAEVGPGGVGPGGVGPGGVGPGGVGPGGVGPGGAGLVYAVALSEISRGGIARSSLDTLWLSLGRLWDAVDAHGERRPIAVPIVGSGLARIDALDRESLLKMLLMSFVARSRRSVVARELRVVVHPDDRWQIDLLEVAAFLRTL
ncbi:macro domain-containing protein [Cryptosporangium sp. NPDC051539]|uniref:macro domain-containing protein n=1 Tax=Cryptosporangium sp. NPDC051539 TaxID=3363962 RepID=UPI0037A8FABA